MAKSEKEKLGALWTKKFDDGREVWSGLVTIGGVETRIDVWPNSYKKEQKHPDFLIYKNNWVPKAGSRTHVQSKPDDGDADDEGVPF